MQRDIDCLIITHGMALLFELKRPGNAEGADAFQRAKLRKWERSARYCGVSDSADEIIRIVEEIANEAQIKEKLYKAYQEQRISYLYTGPKND